MGEKACLYLLSGAHTRLASLIYVSVLLCCDFHVSIIFNHCVFTSLMDLDKLPRLQFYLILKYER